MTVNDIPVKISNKKDILTLAREMKRTDKIGNDFPMPKDNTWDILTTIDSVDADTYDMFATIIMFLHTYASA